MQAVWQPGASAAQCIDRVVAASVEQVLPVTQVPVAEKTVENWSRSFRCTPHDVATGETDRRDFSGSS